MDSDGIKQLADAIRQQTLDIYQGSTVQTISAVSFKAPPFWNTNASAWFLRLESSFATHQPAITNDLTKFHHVVQLLDSSTSRRVQSVIERPPQTGKYEALKHALLEAYEATQYQKDTALLNINGLGDKRPTELLMHMRSLNADPSTLFRTLFIKQMPTEVRRILAQSPEVDLDTLAKMADRILEVDPLTPSSISVTTTVPEENLTTITDTEINAMKSQHQGTGTIKFKLCKYHSWFGHKARKCEQIIDGCPCPMSTRRQQGNDKASRN
ncbi:uncharacterized protein LOC106177495 [Lingula anatina]|uniref:Uncharacterized protein LOC106177495 n=1 Tax=Lingula anatina TaxID=7574 RepID=A0A1S3JZB3_LINAN|nr:uncharacterized protein LOC106177495 [Lingula anatina]|eukprot:XP_013415735.1 uncharacterized protein LOC106177495 [Lingula anatina]